MCFQLLINRSLGFGVLLCPGTHIVYMWPLLTRHRPLPCVLYPVSSTPYPLPRIPVLLDTCCCKYLFFIYVISVTPAINLRALPAYINTPIHQYSRTVAPGTTTYFPSTLSERHSSWRRRFSPGCGGSGGKRYGAWVPISCRVCLLGGPFRLWRERRRRR